LRPFRGFVMQHLRGLGAAAGGPLLGRQAGVPRLPGRRVVAGGRATQPPSTEKVLGAGPARDGGFWVIAGEVLRKLRGTNGCGLPRRRGWRWWTRPG
jgi:hypothetical protein